MLTNHRILVTGADGFIGKNLVTRLVEYESVNVSKFVRNDDIKLLPQLVSQVDAVVHLAGENRPTNVAAYQQVNVDLTLALCNTIKQEFYASGRHIPLVFASSIHVESKNQYGLSKFEAEVIIKKFAEETKNPCAILRLPGVFGKWCKPNYNSVVATFCYNAARGLPIKIDDQLRILRLVHIDEVVNTIVKFLEKPLSNYTQLNVVPEYTISVGQLAKQIQDFENCRSTLISDRVGTGFLRALYSTYLSYLPYEKFSYELPKYADSRGVFVEMLKTIDSGQFSFFTAIPGITRGEHYHHTKTEKFLVVKGDALFRFRHLISKELIEIKTTSAFPQVVDTIPGWSHDITNIGSDEMIVMLWSNENFDRENPDTFNSKI